MIADFFTKPLQGALFHKFRNTVLGIKERDFEHYELEYLNALKKYNLMESADTIRLQECVERNKNKERRTDDETKQDEKTVSSFSSKNEQDWNNNNETTISNNTEERVNNNNSNNGSKSVHFAHFSSVYQI
mmetsp:Transcript_4825/g.10215  ORF Transcript_4825/g.10215 Transcript_4825/m.10215 type:complete len:131 (-) Transcript_4825:525-917(-)